jgi:hypothetical protein
LTQTADHGDGSAAAMAAGIAALAHLQSAALEMIAALRATLDVAEDLVRDPSVVAAGGTLAGVVTRVFEAVEPLLGGPDGQARQSTNEDGPVEHIQVS